MVTINCFSLFLYILWFYEFFTQLTFTYFLSIQTNFVFFFTYYYILVIPTTVSLETSNIMA